MGLFIENYQVFNTKKLSNAELTELVRQVFSSQRDVALRFHEDNSWVSIYPESMEEIQAGSSKEMLNILSKTMNSPCLFVLVYDSDLTLVALCDADRNMENTVYYGMKETLEELVGVHPIQWHGDSTKWQAVLTQPMSLGEWEQFWTFNPDEYSFAEEILYLFGDKIGLPGESLVCDYGMLLDAEHSGKQVIYLR